VLLINFGLVLVDNWVELAI